MTKVKTAFTGNYERFVQWVSGPVAGAAGYGALQLISHTGVLNDMAHGHDSDIALAITKSVAFGGTALATFAMHHKWLDNAAKWWDSEASKAEEVVTKDVAKADPTDAATIEHYIEDVDSVVNEILTGQQAQAQVQDMEGHRSDNRAALRRSRPDCECLIWVRLVCQHRCSGSTATGRLRLMFTTPSARTSRSAIRPTRAARRSPRPSTRPTRRRGSARSSCSRTARRTPSWAMTRASQTQSSR